MNKEIELKFEISDIPNMNEYKKIELYKISQNYIYQDMFSAIRTRKIVNLQSKEISYIYTVKTKGDVENNYSVYEIESNITKDEYISLQSNSNIVEKYRIEIPLKNKLIAEIDVYYGNLEGLITVEVEFSNESDVENFIKPVWFGNTLDKKIFSNANLSKMERKDFLKIIDKNKFEKNMKIKKYIEDYLIKYM